MNILAKISLWIKVSLLTSLMGAGVLNGSVGENNIINLNDYSSKELNSSLRKAYNEGTDGKGMLTVQLDDKIYEITVAKVENGF
jgi:hypothetical protein